MRQVCSLPGVKERLHESNVAFAPLQSMMASSYDPTASAATQVRVN